MRPGNSCTWLTRLSRAYISDADGELEEEVVIVHTVQVSEPRDVEAHKDLQQRQFVQKSFYDRSNTAPPPLKEGDEVVVRTNKENQWKPAKIVQQHETPR